MKAIIFAAGLGSRLGQITRDKPKALIEIGGKPLLELAIRKLMKYGVDEIIINIHHMGEMIIDFLKVKKNFGIRIEISDEREQLMDTGGGLMKASWFFDDKNPFLTYNVDVLSTLDLSAFVQYHNNSGSLVSLACKARNTERYFLTDQNNRLTGWENRQTGERIDSARVSGEVFRVGYSGISVIEPELLNLVTERGPFSLTSLYLRLARKKTILVYRHDEDFWMDIGKTEQLKAALNYFKNRDVALL
ncbi:MAG: nucleotidyltransferase family protein [Bacteroidales bacterium]|nr:MAG: nucleotidyltransferase family protein [Bacteroidales bacterium]